MNDISYVVAYNCLTDNLRYKAMRHCL